MSTDFSSAGEPSGPGASREVRASDADRDRVADVLCAAAGDGRLTAGEFDERLEAALSSRTLGELAVLTADLAGGPGRSGGWWCRYHGPAARGRNGERVNNRQCSRWRNGADGWY